jgi:hypothetical protein
MAGLNYDKFENALNRAAAQVNGRVIDLAEDRANLQRIARAAHAAGMSERQIARAVGRSGPAVHAWLHAGDKK